MAINKLILTAGPSITSKEIDYVTDAVTHGWNEKWNEYIVRFETSFSEFIGVKHSMTTSSCTGALHLGLMACGIGNGDEVIVPEISWVASASSVVYTGAKPVFCDIEEGSWCIDVKAAESMITNRTKAIMPVHLYGHPANMPDIMKLAKKYNLYVIEDAAPSIGAEIAGKRTGSFGHVSGFSFQGAKILVTGEGGMLVSNDTDIFNKAQSLSDHGRDPDSPLSAVSIGYKYKMSNIQAALGLAQLERANELVNRKRGINSRYRDNLKDCPSVRVSEELPGCKSIHWMTSLELLGNSTSRRTEIMGKLKERLVDTRPVFSPMSSLPMFSRISDNPVAYRIGENSINLPSGHNLTDEQIDYVSETIIYLCGQ